MYYRDSTQNPSMSEMALISEWMEQCGKKALDNAGIVREA
jgi:hypothetical protein